MRHDLALRQTGGGRVGARRGRAGAHELAVAVALLSGSGYGGAGRGRGRGSRGRAESLAAARVNELGGMLS